MSLRNRLVLPIVLSSLAALGGCGSTNSVVPPPTGAFSNTDFNGTYTFSVEGADVNGPMSIAGSLTACGCTGGTISGGATDFNDPLLTAPGSAIGNNSTYSINKDGRGTAKLFITPTGGTAFVVSVDFVLTSSSHGLITRYDSSGTGSGTIDLQAAAVAQSSLDVTPYAFTLSGGDSATPSSDIISTVGSLTLNSSGTITAGVEDCNVNGGTFFTSALSGSVLVGSGTTPGSATILTSCASGALTFDVYTIDSTHLKLIESDGAAFLVGDAFAQTSDSIPSGGLVFTMAGLDSSGAPFVSGGTVTSNSGSQLSGGLEDVNDNSFVDGGVTPAVPLSFGGTFVASPSGSGRFQVALSGTSGPFFGGTDFVAYPSSGGILMLETDIGLSAGVTSGIALPQTAGAGIAATQGYGLNNTGVDFNSQSELDEIAQFTTTSTGMTGLLDDNDGGSLNTSNVNGSYTAGSNGAGSATIGSRLQSVFYYAADSSTVLFISTDPNQIAAGVFEAQTAPSGNADQASTVRPRALPMFRALPRSRKGMPHNQGKIGLAK